MKVTFGRYKGRKIEDVPLDYLEWGSTNLSMDQYRYAFSDEIARRNNTGVKESLNDYDNTVFGMDKTENIVNMTIENDKVYVYKTDGTEVIDYKPWVLSNKPGKVNKSKRLLGNQYYKYLTELTYDDYIRVTSEWNNSIWSPRSIEEGFMLKNGYTHFKGMKMEEISVLSFDIEATGLKGYADNAEVLMISNTFRNRLGKISKKLFDLRQYKSDSEMITDWCDWVREQDPDVMIGHNVFGYDLPYLAERCELNLGRNGSSIQFEDKTSKFRKDATQQYEYHNAKIHGRTIIDTMFLSIKIFL